MPVAASPLASVTVPFTPAAGYGDVTFTFPSPTRVDSGKQYAILISAPNENADANVFIAWQNDLGSSLHDPNGTACADGAYPGGRAWAFDPEPPGADSDFFFATYVVPVRQITVQKAGAGSGTVQDTTSALSCGVTCSAEFKEGESVVLTAAPDATSVFTGWSGACSGTTLSCSIMIDSDAAITATFARKAAVLNVRHTGAGSVSSRPPGLSCGKRCRAEFAPGMVTLTARPAVGWRFARWAGACRGTKPVCRLTLAAGKSAAAKAVFSKKAK